MQKRPEHHLGAHEAIGTLPTVTAIISSQGVVVEGQRPAMLAGDAIADLDPPWPDQGSVTGYDIAGYDIAYT